ncbi:MAG: hypothetical protein RBU29_09735 [bacterium]|jgi:hypothetical protein|nr:hypothetical protein [bacterium]
MKKVAMLAFCAVFVASPLWADRVDDLETKILQLEQQLQELKGALEQEKEAKAPEAAPAKEGMQLVGPGGTLSVGGDIRWRGRFFDNLWDFNSSNDGDQSESYRFRPRVWLDWKPTEDSEAYVRFAKEWLMGQDGEMPGYEVDAKDVLFDNAWFLQKDIFGLPVDIKIGRQDLVYGEGFVIIDGTPNDGSQTISFDAAKATLKHDWGSTDFLLVKTYENNSSFADDEDFYGIYNKWKLGGFGLEPYLLYRNKNQGPNISPAAGTAAPGSSSTVDPSPREETVLLGFRGTRELDLTDGVKLALAGEIGKEWGEMDFTGEGPGGWGYSRFAGANQVDRDAWGGTFNGILTFADVMWTPSIKGAFTYTTGDDPTTADYEGWDDFYAQFPKYSELYIYTLYDGFKGRSGVNDPDVGAWGNMMIPEVAFTVKPTTKYSQTLRYLYFMADEKNGPGLGDERGHNLQWLSTYDFSKNLSGHFLAEWFDPGDYYAIGADDAFFVRFQLLYQF